MISNRILCFTTLLLMTLLSKASATAASPASATVTTEAERLEFVIPDWSTPDLYTFVWLADSVHASKQKGRYALRRIDSVGTPTWQATLTDPWVYGPFPLFLCTSGGYVFLATRRDMGDGDIWIWDSAGTLQFTTHVESIIYKLICPTADSPGSFLVVGPSAQKPPTLRDRYWLFDTYGPNGKLSGDSVRVLVDPTDPDCITADLPESVTLLPTGEWLFIALRPPLHDPRTPPSPFNMLCSWVFDPKTARIHDAQSLPAAEAAIATGHVNSSDCGYSRIYPVASRDSTRDFLLFATDESGSGAQVHHVRFSPVGQLMGRSEKGQRQVLTEQEHLGHITERVAINVASRTKARAELVFDAAGGFQIRYIDKLGRIQ